MGSVYQRKNRLWIRFKGPDDQWTQSKTGLFVGQEKQAARLLEEVEAKIHAGALLGEVELGTPTLTRLAAKWIADRKARGVGVADDDNYRLQRHVLPVLGHMPIDEIRPRHIRGLVRDLARSKTLRKKKDKEKLRDTLAPRTIRSIYGTLHTLFEDAVADELIDHSPCVLKRGELPRKIDKDPLWRAGAVFTHSEVEALISSEDIPEDRCIVYALAFLTGMRPNELVCLRWRYLDGSAEPLGRIQVAVAWDRARQEEKGVKSERPREVPIHLTLARMLATWKLGGFERFTGRTPTEDDLVIPSLTGKPRNVSQMLERFHADLDRLRLRRRRLYDARRTFISLAQGDGSRRDVLRWVTHGPTSDVFDAYTTMPWPALCQAVSCLRIELREGQLLSLPKALNSRGLSADFASLLATPAENSRIPPQYQASIGRGVRDSNPWPPA
jgi:integrase